MGAAQMFAKFGVKVVTNDTTGTKQFVTINKLDLKFSCSGVQIDNLALYPGAADQDQTYAIKPAYWLSQDSARFILTDNTALTSADYNKLIATSTQLFVVRGDIIATAQGGNFTVGINDFGSWSSKDLGAGDAGGNIEWTQNGIKTFYGTPQKGPLQLNSSPIVFGSAIGSFDTTVQGCHKSS